jgi:hypothetical protein
MTISLKICNFCFQKYLQNYRELFLVARRKRQQGDIPSLLDGASKTALVGGANAREPPRDNLAAFSHKPLQQANIAVRDRIDLLGAELANLLAAKELAATAGATRRTWSTRRTITLVAATPATRWARLVG